MAKTLQEALIEYDQLVAEYPTDDLLIIDSDTRQIYIPKSEIVFGVADDNDSERKYFVAPKIVGNSLDLSTCIIDVTYVRPDGLIGLKNCDFQVRGDNIIITWVIDENVTYLNGEVKFVVKAHDGFGRKWGTTIANGKVLDSIEYEPSEEEKEQVTDWVQQVIASIPSDYTSFVERVDAQFEVYDSAIDTILLEQYLPLSKKVTDLKKEVTTQSNQIAELEQKIQGGSGLSENASRLLIAILRKASFTENMNDYISTLEHELFPNKEEDEPIEPPIVDKYYSVSYALANASSTSDISSVKEGDTYSTTISANEGFKLSNVSVTMNGEDISSVVYNAEDGTIVIENVSGDISITVATIVYVQPAYELPSPLVGDGTKANTHPITTNVKLMDVEKDFTILYKIKVGTKGTFLCSGTTNNQRFYVNRSSNTADINNFFMDKNATMGFLNGTIDIAGTLTYDKETHELKSKWTSASGIRENKVTVTAFAPIEDVLTIGCQTWANGDTSGFVNGELSDVKVYLSKLSDDDINAYLGV